jgi:hypothetical protein
LIVVSTVAVVSAQHLAQQPLTVAFPGDTSVRLLYLPGGLDSIPAAWCSGVAKEITVLRICPVVRLERKIDGG